MRVLAGRYELVRLAGRGGMGEVWEGRDRVIERKVAVKVLPYDRRGVSAADQFFREARTAGALNHPGVVTVFDAGQDGEDGSLFLVMEFVDGRDLATVLHEDGPPAVPTVLDWAAQVASALDRAHRAGVVHRDLKPANLMLTDNGRIKVLDFGIARFVEATRTSSVVMGTLAYMPPERFDEQPGDGRSDLYSLGCVMHELLTGALPFDASGPVSMMNAHLRRPAPRPSALRGDVPPGVDALVLALMAKEPRQRPADAGEVVSRLKALGDGPATHAAGAEDTTAVPVPAGTPTVRNPAAPAPETDGERPGRGVKRRRALLLSAGVAALLGGGIPAALRIGNPDRKGSGRGDHPAVPPGSGPPALAAKWVYRDLENQAIASASVHDEIVYVTGRGLHAIGAGDGKEKWVSSTGDDLFAYPSVQEGSVYVRDNRRLHAVDAVNGTHRWTFNAGSVVLPTPAVTDGKVYFSTADGQLHEADAATGKENWSIAFPNDSYNLESPVAAHGLVYLTGRRWLRAVDPATRTTKWVFDTPERLGSTLIVDGGACYIRSEDGTFYVVDAATGAKRIAIPTGTDSLRYLDGVIYGASGRRLYATPVAAPAQRTIFEADTDITDFAVSKGFACVLVKDGLSGREALIVDTATGARRATLADLATADFPSVFVKDRTAYVKAGPSLQAFDVPLP